MKNPIEASSALLALAVPARLRFLVALGLPVLVVIVAATSALAQSALAPSPPLTGEILACNSGPNPEICVLGGTQPAITVPSCPASGTGSFSYTMSGPAFGPYPGTFAETGSVTSGPLSELPVPPF